MKLPKQQLLPPVTILHQDSVSKPASSCAQAHELIVDLLLLIK